MYHFSSIFNNIRTFLFKRMLMSFNCFFSLIKTNIFHLIQFIIIVVAFQKLWCLVIDGTYPFGLNYAEFIHHVVNNSVVLLFFWDLLLGMGLLPRSLAG